jgi:hypothetical protein
MSDLRAWPLLALALMAQSYPPPFPRPGVTKLLENNRVIAWNVVWPKGQPTALHRHIYDLAGVYYASGDRLITDADGTKRFVQNTAGGHRPIQGSDTHRGRHERRAASGRDD